MDRNDNIPDRNPQTIPSAASDVAPRSASVDGIWLDKKNPLCKMGVYADDILYVHHGSSWVFFIPTTNSVVLCHQYSQSNG